MYRVFTAQPATRGNPFGVRRANPQFAMGNRPQRGQGGACPAGWHYEVVPHLGWMCVKDSVPPKPTPSSPGGGSGSIAIPSFVKGMVSSAGWVRGPKPAPPCPPGQYLWGNKCVPRVPNPYPPGAKTPSCEKGCTLHWAKDVGYYCHCGIIKTKSTPLTMPQRFANPSFFVSRRPQAGQTCAKIKCQPGNVCKCDVGFCHCTKPGFAVNPLPTKKDIDKKCWACPAKGDCIEVPCTESAYARAVRLAKARRASTWRLA